MSRSTMVVYRKSKGQVVTRLPAHMMSIDDAGRIHGRDNMYLVLAQESNADALNAWKCGAKSASAATRRNLAAELEPRGLKIARIGDNGVLLKVGNGVGDGNFPVYVVHGDEVPPSFRPTGLSIDGPCMIELLDYDCDGGNVLETIELSGEKSCAWFLRDDAGAVVVEVRNA